MLVLLCGVAACSGGNTAVQVSADAQADVVADAAAPDTRDAAVDAALGSNDRNDSIDRIDPMDAASDGAPADVVDGGASDVSTETRPTDARVDAAVEAHADTATQKPPATATWTLSSFPLCTAAGAGCMDTGAVGGYEITASGACPTASDIQLWFPGGVSPVAAGSYAVKAAAGILDVISMSAGMVGVFVERGDTTTTQTRFWGRSGSVTVTASGSARHVTLTGVSLKEETSGAAATLGADVTCP
jgi:hypothetical protein